MLTDCASCLQHPTCILIRVFDDGIDQRLDRIERTLTDISERMATKVELEATQENVKKMADGYMAIGRRLDVVADLLKPRFS